MFVLASLCSALLLAGWVAEAKAFNGADYARQLLLSRPTSDADAEAFYTTLQSELPGKLRAMSQKDQIQFVATLVESVASQKNTDDVLNSGYRVQFILGISKLETSVMVLAMVPMLADQKTKGVVKTYLSNLGRVRKADGTLFFDHAIFTQALAAGLALPELVEFMYDRSGDTAAIWFVENLSLNEIERKRIRGIISVGAGWEQALRSRDSKPFPSKMEQEQLLAAWLTDESWIVAQYAKWLLKRHSAWKASLTESVADQVAVPKKIQFRE